MSIVYCEKCQKYIDTDYNAEHFEEDVDGCEDIYYLTNQNEKEN
jgi:hypothetical protein